MATAALEILNDIQTMHTKFLNWLTNQKQILKGRINVITFHIKHIYEDYLQL